MKEKLCSILASGIVVLAGNEELDCFVGSNGSCTLFFFTMDQNGMCENTDARTLTLSSMVDGKDTFNGTLAALPVAEAQMYAQTFLDDMIEQDTEDSND